MSSMLPDPTNTSSIDRKQRDLRFRMRKNVCWFQEFKFVITIHYHNLENPQDKTLTRALGRLFRRYHRARCQ
jgi:hypothetical protein